MSKPPRARYRTTNWKSYNAALAQRGSLQIWFDPAMQWLSPPTGKRGRQAVFSDAAIQACLMLKGVFKLALRQTTGMVASLLEMAGLDWPVPNFSTLSRRQKALLVEIPCQPGSGALHLLVDSTGIKAVGDGEWCRRPRVALDTPRERKELNPGGTCPDCGGELRLVGEDVGEILEMITARLKVIEVARPKKSCRCCEKMVQVPAPSRPIPGSMAGSSLLAYVLVSKFDDHLPLYRQNEILARMGADIPRSTLADWCGKAMRTLQPLIERIETSVLASDVIHADDTPIQVLDHTRRAKGLGKGVKQGRIWGYVCDQRPWSGAAPPGVAYRFAPNWKAEHVQNHLCNASGILQADAYKGYAKLYEPGADGKPRFREAACFAHWRRDFHDIWKARKSPIAREALDRIGRLYDIGREIAGKPADVRRAVRQEHSKPKLEALRAWAEQQLTRIPVKGDLASAFRYGLGRWPAFSLFVEDGRVAIDNNAAERAVRPIGLGRRNWTARKTLAFEARV